MNEKAWVLRPSPRWRGHCIRSIPESLTMYRAGLIRSRLFLVSRHYILQFGHLIGNPLGSSTLSPDLRFWPAR